MSATTNGPGPGLPGGDELPRQQPPPPQPMREEYPTFGVSVGDTEYGRALVIDVPMPRKRMIFPFSKEAAEQLGRTLAAPSVVVPSSARG